MIRGCHHAMADPAWRGGDCLNRSRASISAQACAGEAGSRLWAQSGSQRSDPRVQPGFRADDLFAARQQVDTRSGSQARRPLSAGAGHPRKPPGLSRCPCPGPAPQDGGGGGRGRGRSGEGALLIAESGSELAEDAAESLRGGGGAGGGGARSSAVLGCSPVRTAGHPHSRAPAQLLRPHCPAPTARCPALPHGFSGRPSASR